MRKAPAASELVNLRDLGSMSRSVNSSAEYDNVDAAPDQKVRKLTIWKGANDVV